jgi:hypothetical protein
VSARAPEEWAREIALLVAEEARRRAAPSRGSIRPPGSGNMRPMPPRDRVSRGRRPLRVEGARQPGRLAGFHLALRGGTLVLLAAAAFCGAPAAAREPEDSFPVLLGSFSTTLLGSLPARTENVRRAAAALDGAVLRPGEVLSFNARVGRRSGERGYRMAPLILRENREIQLGGGICQVSSTLFVAALLAGLTPVERHKHSSPVDYIPLGQDATISWGAKDLKLRNDLAQSVRLRVEVVGSTLGVRVEGEEPVEDAYDLEVVERELPAASGDAGASSGREVELYRTRRGGGQEVERELVHRDVYPPSAGRGEGSGR